MNVELNPQTAISIETSKKRSKRPYTSLRKEAKEQNSCLEGQLYAAGIAE